MNQKTIKAVLEHLCDIGVLSEGEILRIFSDVRQKNNKENKG